MRKFVLMLVMLVSSSVYAQVNITSVHSKYNTTKVLEVMKEYHKKYGKGNVNYSQVLSTINYYCKVYDIELAFGLSFFAVESGFTYECKSSYGAVGMGQITKLALKDFNQWYGKSIPWSKMNDSKTFDHNVKVSLGYLRMCWGRYKVIENGTDLVKSYNVGVTNLAKIKNGKSTKYWIDAANSYEKKFVTAYNKFNACKYN